MATTPTPDGAGEDERARRAARGTLGGQPTAQSRGVPGRSSAAAQPPRAEREANIAGFVMKLSTSTDVYWLYQVIGFDIGSARLSPDMQTGLALLARELRLLDEADIEITIVGSASDSRIQTLDADVLGLDRAEAISYALQAFGIPRSRIHAISEGVRGAPSKHSGVIAKAGARGAIVHVRRGAARHAAVTQQTALAVPDAKLGTSLKGALGKGASDVAKGLSMGKVPSLKGLLEKVSTDLLADYSNAVNAEKFGKRERDAFASTWAETMARLMDDPKQEYRLSLERFLRTAPKVDIRALEEEREQLPRSGLAGEYQVSLFRAAGQRSAYEMARGIPLANFLASASEWRKAYPDMDARARALKAQFLAPQ